MLGPNDWRRRVIRWLNGAQKIVAPPCSTCGDPRGMRYPGYECADCVDAQTSRWRIWAWRRILLFKCWFMYRTAPAKWRRVFAEARRRYPNNGA